MWRLFQKFQEKEISVYAAYAAFFLILSAFPAMALLLGLLRYTRLQPTDLMTLLEGYLPDPLEPEIWKLIRDAYENSSPLSLSVSALTALWSAGKGIHGLARGLNRIYGIERARSWLRTRLLCAVYMVFFLLALLLTLVLHVFGNTLARFWQLHGSLPDWRAVVGLRFFLLLGLQTGLFSLMMMYLPEEKSRFRENFPGALGASLGWMGVSGAFSVYLERFSGYGRVYGSVYGLAMGMLWVFACVVTFFLGALVNGYLGRMD